MCVCVCRRLIKWHQSVHHHTKCGEQDRAREREKRDNKNIHKSVNTIRAMMIRTKVDLVFCSCCFSELFSLLSVNLKCPEANEVHRPEMKNIHD